MSGFDLILSTALCLSCSSTQQLFNSTLLINNDTPAIASLSENMTPENVGEQFKQDKDTTTIYSSLSTLRQWISGRHLRIATLEDYPLSYTEVLENGTRIGHGVAFELIDFIRSKFNFTYEVIVPETNIIGSSSDFDRSLIQLLNETKADLAAAFLPLLSDPRSYIYYSTTSLDEGEWIMVMQRPRESATGSGLLAPFDFWVWILIFISLVAVGPIIYLLVILRNKFSGNYVQKPYSLGHCAWFVYGALLKQGSTLSPIADSTRLLFATWWMFITILTSFYTANLTAFLTLSKFTLPYNSVNDILTKNKQFVSIRGGGIEYAIKNTNETLSTLTKMIQNNYAVFSDSQNDSYNLHHFVEKSGYVFVRDKPAINHMLYLDYRQRKTLSLDNEMIQCPFAMAKEPFLKKKRAFAYPKGSNLSELFDPELLSLVESGIIKHLSAKNLPNAEICPQDLGGTERQLRNGDLIMTYYIMMAGFATAVVVFCTEIIFRYINERRYSSNDKSEKWARHGVGRTPSGLVTENNTTFERNNQHSGKKWSKQHRLISHINVTPPPPYQSIFTGSIKGIQRSTLPPWAPSGQRQPDASFQSDGIKRVINGREYMVFENPQNGQSQLVPVRVPSATLFQYNFLN